MRIACLLPSASEIVASLGAAAEIVGRSHECDHPPEIAARPVLTSARIDSRGSSRAIHREMEQALTDALSIYSVDVKGLRALGPDVVVTQAQCEVCAVSEAEVRSALAAFAANDDRPTALASLSAADLDGIFVDIENVAALIGRQREGRALIAGMQSRLDRIASVAQGRERTPRVALIEWIEPLMAGGNWMPELISLVGGKPLFARAGAHSPWISWDEIRTADPDAILIAPCGFDLERTADDARSLLELPGFADLRAVRTGCVAVADGNAFFNRPGPRIVETAEIIAEFLHPSLFGFGHEGKGWRRFAAPAD